MSWRSLPHSVTGAGLERVRRALCAWISSMWSLQQAASPDSPTQAPGLRAPKNTCHKRARQELRHLLGPTLEVSRRALHLLTLRDEAVTKTLALCRKNDIDSLLDGKVARTVKTRNSIDIIFGENTTCDNPPQKI